MLNLNGDINRRKINMGTRSPRITRESLLKRAEMERTKRQEERHQLNAILTIQRHIRRWLSADKTYHYLAKNIEKVKLPTTIFTTFKKRLYPHLRPEEYSSIINHCKNSLTLAKVSSELLSDVAERNTCKDLDSVLISKSRLLNNPLISDRDILNKFKFIQNCKYDIPMEMFQNILNVDIDSDLYTGAWNLLFYLDWKTAEVESNGLNFLAYLFSYKYLPDHNYLNVSATNSIANYVHNFFFASRNIPSSRIPIFSSLLLLGCSKLEEPLNLSSSIDQDVIRTILPSAFQYSTELFSQYWVGSHYLLAQVNLSQRNSILLSIASSSDIRNGLLDSLSEKSIDLDINAASICAQMFNFYIPLLPDDHLFKSIINQTRLQNMTINMTKLLLSNILYKKKTLSEADIEVISEMMWKLIYLDCRVQYLHKGPACFWELLPNGFHEIDISKEILDFEQYYRDYLVKIEEIYLDEDEMFDKKKAMDQMIKSQYLKNLKEKNRLSSSRLGKLELLFRLPFMIKFFERVKYFNLLIDNDRERFSSRDNIWGIVFGNDRHKATIRRAYPLEDAYSAFGSFGEGFKEKLGIQFVNEFGPEAGIDGGGITKEFLQTLIEEAFNKNSYQLFSTTPFHKLYPSNSISSENLKYISFMGKVLGKCLYDHILVDVDLADFFLKKILNVENNMNVPFNDLYSLDPEYYKNLMKLLEMSKEELQSMDLFFEIDSTAGHRVPLINDGFSIKVNRDNVFEYITRVAHYKLNLQLYSVTSRFVSGLSFIIPPHWLRMFTSYELKTLISGSERELDVDDLKANTEYGGYTETNLTIKYFWQVLESFDAEEKRKFLKFVFSVPTAPLQGFHSLNPLFGIHNAGRDKQRLPTASTCVNLLKLPDYQDYEILKTKLLASINSNSRFELS